MPERYELEETLSSAYQDRTARNVWRSDATLVFTYGHPEGGSALTVKLAHRAKRPVLRVDLEQSNQACVETVREWLRDKKVCTLNVAGSRESSGHGRPVHGRVFAVMTEVLKGEAACPIGDSGGAVAGDGSPVGGTSS